MPCQFFSKAMLHKTWLVAAILASLSGCQQTLNERSSDSIHSPTRKPLAQLLAEKSSSENYQVVKDGIESLLAGDYISAGESINRALSEDPTNAWLHYLNGLRYHMMARQGEVTNYELAKAGYEQALKYEPANAMASLQLGRVYSEQKQYHKAQNEFANTLLVQANNYDALYELACASYYLGDIKTAHMAIQQAQKLHPDKPEVRKATAMILAAAGKQNLAEKELKKYYQAAGDVPRTKRLEGRIQDWRKLYQSGLVLAQADTGQLPNVDEQMSADAAPPAFMPQDDAGTMTSADGSVTSDASAASPIPAPGAGEMVVFDAIVMRVSDIGGTSKGNNILEKFTLTLAPGTHVYARSSTTDGAAGGLIGGGSILGTGDGAAGGFTLSSQPGIAATRVFAQGLSFGNVLYSLNIANITREHIEVVGRPTLVASVGKPAKFFSGDELVAGLAGANGGSGALVKTPVGVTLEITPVSIKDGKIIFNVTLYGSLLNANDLANNINEKFTRIGSSKVMTSVEVALGETIMLGGLSERTDSKNKSGFPFIQDVPFFQYFLSHEATTTLRKTVMYLITPRTYDANKKSIQTANLERRSKPNISELELRNQDWYDPDYNMVVTLRHLAPLYREFRLGDLDTLQWDMPESLDESLEAAASFLYY